jgi:putative transposase
MFALEIMPDHLHLFVCLKLTHIPYLIIKQLKGVTSFKLREHFPELVYLGYSSQRKQFPHLWARGYYCGSASHVSQEVFKRYILEQHVKMYSNTISMEIQLDEQRSGISLSEKKS